MMPSCCRSGGGRLRVHVGLPASILSAYSGWELAALGLAGAVIAVAGAMLPAGWAASVGTASALHAE